MEKSNQLRSELKEVIASLEDYLRCRKEDGVEGLPVSAEALPPFDERPTAGKAHFLRDIRQELGECTRCKLHRQRTHIVFGVGNPEARLVFVGEGPGEDEDRQGEPFVGRAGQLLTKIIGSINLSRDEVYIANIIKCRPPGNRNPEPDEIRSCEPFLIKQLEAIGPKIICALGTFAAQTLLQTDEKISRLRGRFFSYRNARLIATFHPAFLLRNPERKRDVWEDMKMIREEYCR